MEIEFESIARLNLEPGEILVVKLSHAVPASEMERLQREWKELFSRQGMRSPVTVFLTKDVTLSKLKLGLAVLEGREGVDAVR